MAEAMKVSTPPLEENPRGAPIRPAAREPFNIPEDRGSVAPRAAPQKNAAHARTAQLAALIARHKPVRISQQSPWRP